MKHVQGKIAVVTGASREAGIGSAICMELARSGADIFFTHWLPFDEKEGNGAESSWPNQLQEKIQELGVRVAHMELDLTRIDAPEQLWNTVETKLGTPTILINNATYQVDTNYRTLTIELLDKHYEVNNRGTIMLAIEFAKRYEQACTTKKDGRIINLISGGPDPNNLAYIATKGALIAMTEPLAVGLAPIGITVNSVDPGPTDSGWMDDSIKDMLRPLFPSGRIGLPEDVARLITFLASEESSWITGQTIRSNGGFIGK